MGWFKQDTDVPAEIKDLTPAQLAEAVKKSKSLESELETLKASQGESSNAVKRLEGDIASLQAALAEAKAKAEANPQRRASDQQEEDDIITNPSGFVQRETAPLAGVAFHSGALAARMYAEQEINSDPIDRVLYKKYKGEVDKILETQQPQAKILPQTYINSFTYVKGLHAKDIKDAASGGDESFFSEGVSGRQRTGEEGDASQGAMKLTDQELKVAAKMRVTPEKYLENKKAMKVVAHA